MITLAVELKENQCFAGQELQLKVTLTNASFPVALQSLARFDEQQRDSLDEIRRRSSRSPPLHRGHKRMASTGSDFATKQKGHVRKLSLVADASLSEAIATSPTTERRMNLHSGEVNQGLSPSTSPTRSHRRQPSWLNHRRRSSQIGSNGGLHAASVASPPRDEEIVMLHAQITGQFTLDPTLIKSDSFEHLKGKAFTGGSAAGGLVGTQTKVVDAWSFSNLKSILLDPAQSSLAELRETTSSRQIPILSMPPTILGVDINLRQGQQEIFYLRCALPSSLPSGYQGKAIKISYGIKLTAQRSDNTFKTVELPLRIYGSFTKMSPPYACDKPHIYTQSPLACATSEAKPLVKSTLTKQDFERYLELLLPRKMSVPVMPVIPSPTMERSGYFNPESMHESLAIYKNARQAPVKFDIARAGEKVGVISLPGTLFSAGQTIMGTIDFKSAALNCFGVEVSLELSETIPEWLAVKTPEQSLLSTRRILSSQVETTAFAKEAIIELPVPALAPPSFQTTAAKVEYNLLIEFLVAGKEPWLHERQGKHGIEKWPLEKVEAEPFECRIPVQILVGKASEASGGTCNLY